MMKGLAVVVLALLFVVVEGLNLQPHSELGNSFGSNHQETPLSGSAPQNAFALNQDQPEVATRDVPSTDTYNVAFIVSSLSFSAYLLPPVTLTWGAGTQLIGNNPLVPGQGIYKYSNAVLGANPYDMQIAFLASTGQDWFPLGSNIGGELLTSLSVLIGCNTSFIQTNGITYTSPYGAVINTSSSAVTFFNNASVAFAALPPSFVIGTEVDPFFVGVTGIRGAGIWAIQFDISIKNNPAPPATTGQATTGRATTAPITTAPITTGRATTAPITTGQATTGRVTTGQATTGRATTTPATTGRVTTGLVTSAPATTGRATTAAPATTGRATTAAPVTTGRATTAAPATTGRATTGRTTTGAPATTGRSTTGRATTA